MSSDCRRVPEGTSAATATGPGYSREEMLGAERWAWAGDVRSGRAEFCFDGIQLWHQGGSGVGSVARQPDVPARGWWPRPECNCPLCTGRGEA
jgi:hypothetical protein